LGRLIRIAFAATHFTPELGVVERLRDLLLRLRLRRILCSDAAHRQQQRAEQDGAHPVPTTLVHRVILT